MYFLFAPKTLKNAFYKMLMMFIWKTLNTNEKFTLIAVKFYLFCRMFGHLCNLEWIPTFKWNQFVIFGIIIDINPYNFFGEICTTNCNCKEWTFFFYKNTVPHLVAVLRVHFLKNHMYFISPKIDFIIWNNIIWYIF